MELLKSALPAAHDRVATRGEQSPRRRVLEAVDARMIAFLRYVMALWALAMAYVHAPDPELLFSFTVIVLSLYCVWAALLYSVATHRPGSALVRLSHWGDIAWVSLLVALTNGTESVYYFLFVFCIMVAGFSRGRREGLAVTAVCTVVFGIIGWVYWQIPELPGDRDLNRALMRPMYLVVFGIMTSLWGQREIVLRERLLYLRDVGRKWNPSIGRDRATAGSLHRLREFMRGSKCILAVQRAGDPPTWWTYLDAVEGHEGGGHAYEVDEVTARLLLALPHDRQLVYSRGRTRPPIEECERLANFFDVDHFATVGYRQADGSHGRLFLTFPDGPCSAEDLDFIAQAAAAIAQVVENSRLSEELVANAAQKERVHLSLGLHDTTVQPYVGLKLALEALRREAGADNPLAPRIAQIAEMADATIRDLRGFASELRADVSLSPASLVKTIHHHAERMERFYGVHVDVDISPAAYVSPYVAGELYCIVAEGFSNIVRHTDSRRAFVRMTQGDRSTVLSIGNETARPAPPFVPRSINERARSIGAACRVETGEHTTVRIEVPT